MIIAYNTQVNRIIHIYLFNSYFLILIVAFIGHCIHAVCKSHYNVEINTVTI